MAGSRSMPDNLVTPSLENWRRMVEKALTGGDFGSLQSRTRDGIVIEPLYKGGRDLHPLPSRGPGQWKIIQIVDDPDPECANEQALEDLRGGATGLALRFAGAPAAASFGLPPGEEALRIVLQDVDLASIHLRIDPHRTAPEIANRLTDLVARRGIAPERADISFGLDPISVLAFQGNSVDPGEFVACLLELRSASFRGGLATLDGRVFHEAGATEAQELAAILAAGTWWLRALDSAGIRLKTALGLFAASLAADRDQLLSVAKIRALRLLWARIQDLCGALPAPIKIHAETGRRMMTRADPHTNLLRTTIGAFAAGVGGADSVAILPYTAALGLADRSARALARNAQHILIEEAHLHRVADPAAGSGAVEALTDALAERAWEEFQMIERDGGIIESLRSNGLPARIAEARDVLKRELAGGVAPLVGATAYRVPIEKPSPAERALSVAPSNPGRLSPVRLETLAATV
jgi:methylmalonyl-CoA mutase